jgi:hypothetical protein
MENKIICPECGKTIPNNPVIDSAVNKENLGSTFVTCECGETITYWAIIAQLRDQNTFGRRFKNWLQKVTRSRDQSTKE